MHIQIKHLAIVALALFPLILNAQTLAIQTGSVTYLVPAADMGFAKVAGDEITILNRTFNTADIDCMTVDDTVVNPATITVSYAGSSAAVTVSADIMTLVDITVSGADVTVTQDEALADEITYTLSGSSTDGSFYMDGKLKATVVLDNLSLTSLTTAPINIRNGKRIAFQLNGTSTLADTANSDGKGALMVNGHSEFTGDGTLNICGYAKHAYWADEYIQLKKTFTGEINILAAAGDGINVNQYFQQNGGTINISGTGDDGIQVSADDDETGYALIKGGTLNIDVTAQGAKGLKTDGDIDINDDMSTPIITITSSASAYYDSSDKEIKGTSCISSDADITINAGTITLTATGTAGKGLKSDGTLEINGGDITVSTSGTRYAYGSDTSSPKGMRADAGLVINGGTINVSATGKSDGSEGIESKALLTINGGEINVTAYDDAINSAEEMDINGGTIQVVSQNNDGLDSNADLVINGGTVLAYGAAQPECSIDAAESYGVYINGGTVLGVGGSAITIESSSKAHYATTTAAITANTAITLADSSGQTLFTATVPDGYNSSSTMSPFAAYAGPGGNTGGTGGTGGNTPGGSTGNNPGGNNPGGSMGGSGYQILISTPDITSGQSYTITSGTASSTVTAK
ncbi:MAG: carbohydrate-binding domain-containing protein [Prevotella sp.]|nr:carbohydrate-binding domain-containing protein [Prevotella sp.]